MGEINQPITFNNQPEEWTSYVALFDMYFTAANINDNNRKLALLLYCGGEELRKVYSSLTVPLRDAEGALLQHEVEGAQVNIDPYQTSITALNNYYNPRANVIFERSKFRSLSQTSNETSMQFITRLRTGIRSCDFVNYTEDAAIVDQYVEKCCSSKMRRLLLKEQNLTTDIIIRIAQSEETSTSQAARMEEVATTTSYNTEPEIVNRLYNRPRSNNNQTTRTDNSYRAPKREPQEHSKVCYGCGSQEHIFGNNKCPAKGRKCKFCKIPGHLDTVCRKKQFDAGLRSRGPRTGQSTYQVTEEDQEETNNVSFTNNSTNNSTTINNSTSTTTTTTDNSDFLYRVNNKHKCVTVSVDNVPTDFIIDSGSTVNLIDQKTFRNYKNRLKLLPTSKEVFTYGSTDPLKLIGECQTTMTLGDRKIITSVLVTELESSGCILSSGTSTALGVLEIKQHHNINQMDTAEATENQQIIQKLPVMVKNLLNKHIEVTQGIGKLKDYQLKLDIDPDVGPFIQRPYKIPFHKRTLVEDKIKQLVQDDILEPVHHTTTWCSPLVIVPKKSGEIRLCLDLRLANTAVKRTRHPIPTVEEVFEKLTGCEVFSKIDLKAGYRQIELAEESRDITTFRTESGLYRSKRLVFGVNSAAEKYQWRIGMLFANEQNIQNISDDILVAGKTQKEHDKALTRAIKILHENNLTINLPKCEFNKSSLEFFGFQISKEGTKPTDEKIKSVDIFPEPTNQKELRSFLGLVNYLNKYIKNLAAESTVLRKLTKKDAKWSWTDTERQCFNQLKSLVTSTRVMAHFNIDLPSKVVTDAAPEGLGAMLLQHQINGDWKVVTYISRACTDVESRYSQIEREALGVVWAIEKLDLYLCGSKFQVETDHKPLIGIYNTPNKPLSARLLRWSLRLQPYTFTITYIPGPENPVDCLSRFPDHTNILSVSTADAEEYVNFTLAHSVPKATSLSEIREASLIDPEIMAVREALTSGKWEHNPLLKPYKLITTELSVKNDILLRQNRIVVPVSLRQRMFNIIHETHGLGIVKTKQNMRTKTWWPGVDKFIEDQIKSCVLCSAMEPDNQHPPLKMTPVPNVWENLNIDICGPLPDGWSLFAIVDQASRWPHIYTTKATDTTTIVSKLTNLFSIMGKPVQLISDNGPQFRSLEFQNFCREWNVEHRLCTPYHPQSNGEVERLFRTVKKVINTSFALGVDWQIPLEKFLLTYRNTPHSTTGETPANLLLGRQTNDKLPCLNPTKPLPKSVIETDRSNKEKSKVYADKRCKGKVFIKPGDRVLLKNLKKRKGSLNYNLEPFYVCSGKHGSFSVESEITGKCYRRHATQMKLLSSPDGPDRPDNIQREPQTNRPPSNYTVPTLPTKLTTTIVRQTLPGLTSKFKPDPRLPGVIDRRAATNPLNLHATPCSVVIPRAIALPGQPSSIRNLPTAPTSPTPVSTTPSSPASSPTPSTVPSGRTRWANRFVNKPRPNYAEL